jgi:hypothetical protein
MTDIDKLGGRLPLSDLLTKGSKRGVLNYRDQRQAKAFLDAHKVPFVIIRRQRCYRPIAISEALDRDEQRQLENTTTA